ncbi:uncharacterized protein METZ01_LOCUS386286 [marine metagenome]|uniref:Uncharacterized protein n=1 Tax=marine metagenome TaxID=408172 RepID=A0A382UH40_9ZZZZ
MVSIIILKEYFTLDYLGVELTPSSNREYCIISPRSSSHT